MAEPEKNDHSEEQFDDLSLEELLRGEQTAADVAEGMVIRG